MRLYALALFALLVAGCRSGNCCRETTCETTGSESSAGGGASVAASAGSSFPAGSVTKPVSATPGKADGHPVTVAPTGGTEATPAGDTVAAVDSERRSVAHPTVAQYREFLRRYKMLGAIDKAKDVAREMLAVGDPRLESDRVHRALDGARRAIDRDEHFRKQDFDSIFASPYLICYSTGERLGPEDLAGLPASERRKKLAEIDKKKEGSKLVLAEKAKIFTQLYAEFLKRYGEAWDLHDLMDEYGGRKDLPIGKRSFKDGCPLIVWIFSDRAAFDSYHSSVKLGPISPSAAGYLGLDTGWVYLYDEDDGNREYEISKNVHEGTQQLLYWFMRQKNEWGNARVLQPFFSVGFAEYMGSVIMEKDRRLTFTGLNRPRLESLGYIRKALMERNRAMLVFPVKDLVAFEGYGDVAAWALDKWGPLGGAMGLGIFFIQSWAFTYFLNEYGDHRYQARFGEFVSSILNDPKDAQNRGPTMFKAAFGIAGEGDWEKLDTEFKDYYLGTLAKMKADEIGKQPPARDDWPGYVPPDLLPPVRNGDASPAKKAGDTKPN